MKEIDKGNEKKKYKNLTYYDNQRLSVGTPEHCCSRNKKNVFKINMIFNENGEALENIIERAFGNYCLKRS